MVNVTRATLSQNLAWFIRSLILTNVSDPKSRGTDWVFKGTPQDEFSTSSLPRIIVNVDYVEGAITIDGSKRGPIEVLCYIEVWSDTVRYKGVLTDGVVEAMFSKTAVDSDGKSMMENYMQVMSVDISDEDIYTEAPNVVYRNVISVGLIHSGS